MTAAAAAAAVGVLLFDSCWLLRTLAAALALM